MDSCEFLSSPEGARICLTGLSFPADKKKILRHVGMSGAPEAAIVAANQIPDRTYHSLEELMREFGETDTVMQFQIPRALALDHQALHIVLQTALELQGKVGSAARKLAALLHPHFEKEEKLAMPPLGLLQTLAAGEVTAWMQDVVPLVDNLKAELPQMLQEHKDIVIAVNTLEEVAAKEGFDEYVHFAEKLRVHLQIEEEILYPTGILVGECVKMRLA